MKNLCIIVTVLYIVFLSKYQIIADWYNHLLVYVTDWYKKKSVLFCTLLQLMEKWISQIDAEGYNVLVFILQRLKEKTTSNLPYMFRLPFAAGQVFSSAMLDRLLYQVLCAVHYCSLSLSPPPLNVGTTCPWCQFHSPPHVPPFTHLGPCPPVPLCTARPHVPDRTH